MTDDKKQLNCIIVHGCYGKSEQHPQNKHWTPWVKNKLLERGVKVETPEMPNPWAPVYKDFKKEFERYEVDENTILIGHSCGCAFLVRWLGESKNKVKKLILVAPWKIVDKEDQFRPAFYNYPIDEAIKDRVEEIVMFTADDEENAGKESLQVFHKALGGKIIELKGHGHYTLDDMGTEEFPELLKIVIGEDLQGN